MKNFNDMSIDELKAETLKLAQKMPKHMALALVKAMDENRNSDVADILAEYANGITKKFN